MSERIWNSESQRWEYPGSLSWKQYPGAWCAGPFMVAERVDGKGWNATALFENDDETSNTELVMALQLPSKAAAMDACEEAYENITQSLRAHSQPTGE